MKNIFKKIIFVLLLASNIDSTVNCRPQLSIENKKTESKRSKFFKKLSPKNLWQNHKKGIIVGTTVVAGFYLTMKKLVNPLIRAAIVPGAYLTPDQLNKVYHIPLEQLRPTVTTERGIEIVYDRVVGATNLVVYLMGNGEPIYLRSEVEDILKDTKVNTLVLKYPKNSTFDKTCELFFQEIEAKRIGLTFVPGKVRIIGRSMGGFFACYLAKHGYRILPITPPVSMANALAWMIKDRVWVPEFCSKPFIWGAGWSGNSVDKFLEIAREGNGNGRSEFIFAEHDEIVGPGFKEQLTAAAAQDDKLKKRLDSRCGSSRSLAGHCLGSARHNDDYRFIKCSNCAFNYQRIIQKFATDID